MAVNEGVADYVLCYRAFNERSGRRFGSGVQDRPAGAHGRGGAVRLDLAVRLLTPASWVAMFATRIMHEYGVTSEDFGAVAVADRKHAATNPAAHFYGQPITLEDHQASRWIVEPLHLLDCCQETDGGQAMLVTTRRAGARPAGQAGRHHGGRAGHGGRAADDALVLPREPGRAAGDGHLRAADLGELGPRPGRHPDRGHLRPLHPVRAAAAGGIRLLQARRGEGLHRGRRHRARRPAADQHPRRPARRGVPARHERHRRGRAPDPRHVGQPGRRTSSNVLVTGGTGVPTSALLLGQEG